MFFNVLVCLSVTECALRASTTQRILFAKPIVLFFYNFNLLSIYFDGLKQVSSYFDNRYSKTFMFKFYSL